jgi:hypothetical protein
MIAEQRVRGGATSCQCFKDFFQGGRASNWTLDAGHVAPQRRVSWGQTQGLAVDFVQTADRLGSQDMAQSTGSSICAGPCAAGGGGRSCANGGESDVRRFQARPRIRLAQQSAILPSRDRPSRPRRQQASRGPGSAAVEQRCSIEDLDCSRTDNRRDVLGGCPRARLRSFPSPADGLAYAPSSGLSSSGRCLAFVLVAVTVFKTREAGSSLSVCVSRE